MGRYQRLHPSRKGLGVLPGMQKESLASKCQLEHLITTHGDHTMPMTPFVFCSAKVGAQWLAPSWPSLCHGATSTAPPTAHGSTHQLSTCTCVYMGPDTNPCACIPTWMGCSSCATHKHSHPYMSALDHTPISVSVGQYTRRRYHVDLRQKVCVYQWTHTLKL